MTEFKKVGRFLLQEFRAAASNSSNAVAIIEVDDELVLPLTGGNGPEAFTGTHLATLVSILPKGEEKEYLGEILKAVNELDALPSDITEAFEFVSKNQNFDFTETQKSYDRVMLILNSLRLPANIEKNFT